MNKYLDFFKRSAKAVVALVVTAAAYMSGIIAEDQGLGDVTVAQWLGLIAFMGAAYGLTYGVKNKAKAEF